MSIKMKQIDVIFGRVLEATENKWFSLLWQKSLLGNLLLKEITYLVDIFTWNCITPDGTAVVALLGTLQELSSDSLGNPTWDLCILEEPNGRDFPHLHKCTGGSALKVL